MNTLTLVFPMNKKILPIFLLLFVGAILFQPSLGQTATGDWWIREEDFLIYTLDQATTNGTTGIPVDENVTLYPGMELSFQAEVLPDLNADSSAYINYTVFFGGNNGTVDIPGAPWTQSPFDNDGPPALFLALPTGDDSYWDTISSGFSSNGFVVSSGPDFFNITYTDANITELTLEFSKATGVMVHYYLSGSLPLGPDDVLTPIVLEMTLDYVFSPGNDTFSWAYGFPVLDYRINTARYLNMTDGIVIEPPEQPREKGMIWGGGEWYSGQLLSIDFDYLPDLSVSDMSDGVGYLFYARTDTGDATFNITINYPRTDPESNDMFFYPLLPVPDAGTEPYDAFLSIARTISLNYTTFRTDTTFGLAFESDKGIVSVNWSITTGVLIDFYYHENPSEEFPGMELSFTLLSAADVQDFSLTWNDVPGQTYQYLAQTIDIGGSTEMDVSSPEYPSQFIRQGDVLNLTTVEFSNLDFTTDSENGGVWAKYNIVGPSLDQELIIEIERPGHVVLGEGPPLLYFHLVGGNQAFMDWLVDTFGFSGATVTTNSSTIDISWSYSINGTPVFDLYEAWNATTGVMTFYNLTYYGTPGEESETIRTVFVLEGQVVSEPTTVDTSPATTGISFLDAPILPITVGLLSFSIIVLRKRRFKL